MQRASVGASVHERFTQRLCLSESPLKTSCSATQTRQGAYGVRCLRACLCASLKSLLCQKCFTLRCEKHTRTANTLEWTGERRERTTVLVTSVQIRRDSDIHTVQCPEIIPDPLREATQRTWLYVSPGSFCTLTLTRAIPDS